MTSRGQGAPALAPPLSFRVFKPKGIRKTSVPPPIQNIHSSSMDGTHPFTYSANVAHPYTPAGTVFNFPVPPALHGISCMPPPIRRREEREPRVYSYQSKKTRKKCAEMPSSSRRRPHGRKAAKRPFSCDTCGKRFAQRQGLNRHDRAKHNPSLCIFCDVKWSRPYQYRDHLEAHHPDVDPDTIVGKTAGSRRRAASLARCAPQQQVSPPTTEIGPYPPMPLQPVVVKPPTAAPHAMSFMTYIPQPASAQPTMTKSNPKEHAQAASGRTMLCLRSAPWGGYAGRPPDLETALNPGRTLPVDGYHGCLDPALFQISVAGIDEIWRNAPTFTHAGVGGSGIPY
ncbi:hypothetical protein BJV77DRAFT_241986 [Russula vinacea]|nr:hypothetical protein BJV77DRAFT_241986 [Russula vinacea]